MKRLLSTLRWDIQLQFRNGFYYVSGVVAFLAIIFLRQLNNVNWGVWLPPLILENLVINSFFFMAGLVLLEKGEGTLEAQIVTPLRTGEYLASKTISLGFLSLLETLLIVVLVAGIRFNWLWMALGVLALIAFYGLYGFFVVSRYDSINEFILPSVLWTLAFSLPLLSYFEIYRGWLMYLHPLQPMLKLLEAAFNPLPAWQLGYGFLASTLWIGLVYYLSRRAFYRFVIRKEGARK
jgi:fluoroquinolone transport system permease protein